MKKTSRFSYVICMVLGALLIVFLSVIFTAKADCYARQTVLFDNEKYLSAEQSYKEETKALLEKYGCYNSGLTMTRVVSLDGEREYCIQIHNKKLHRMDEQELAELLNALNANRVLMPDMTEYEVEVQILDAI